MSIVESLRHEHNALKSALDEGKSALALLNESRKELDADPEFDAIFALREAEVNYYIAEAEKKLKVLDYEIALLEHQGWAN